MTQKERIIAEITKGIKAYGLEVNMELINLFVKTIGEMMPLRDVNAVMIQAMVESYCETFIEAATGE